MGIVGCTEKQLLLSISVLRLEIQKFSRNDRVIYDLPPSFSPNAWSGFYEKTRKNEFSVNIWNMGVYFCRSRVRIVKGHFKNRHNRANKWTFCKYLFFGGLLLSFSSTKKWGAKKFNDKGGNILCSRGLIIEELFIYKQGLNFCRFRDCNNERIIFR